MITACIKQEIMEIHPKKKIHHVITLNSFQSLNDFQVMLPKYLFNPLKYLQNLILCSAEIWFEVKWGWINHDKIDILKGEKAEH